MTVVGEACTAWTKGWLVSWVRQSRLGKGPFAAQDSAQYKLHELLISGLVHLIFFRQK